MKTERPRLLVVDDDRAILTLVGTDVTCLDVLKVLRDMSPECELVLMSSHGSLDEAVEALRHTMQSPRPARASAEIPSTELEAPAVSLMEVERQHIVRTLAQVRGNKAVAARLLGISRRAFYRQLERHGLHRRVAGRRRVHDAVAPVG